MTFSLSSKQKWGPRPVLEPSAGLQSLWVAALGSMGLTSCVWLYTWPASLAVPLQPAPSAVPLQPAPSAVPLQHAPGLHFHPSKPVQLTGKPQGSSRQASWHTCLCGQA